MNRPLYYSDLEICQGIRKCHSIKDLLYVKRPTFPDVPCWPCVVSVALWNVNRLVPVATGKLKENHGVRC